MGNRLQRDQVEVHKISYLSTTPPTGAASPEAVYHFDDTANDLNDRTVNGHTLTVNGTSRHVQLDSNVKGFYFNGSTTLKASLSSALHFTEDKTLEVVCSLDSRGSYASPILMEPSPNGEAESQNVLYHLYTNSTSGEISYQHETTSAANVQETSDYIFPLSRVFLWTVTVDSVGTGLKFFINGQLIHSTTLTGPAVNGSTGILQLGLNCTGAISSVRLTETEYTEEQVLEAAQQVGVA